VNPSATRTYLTPAKMLESKNSEYYKGNVIKLSYDKLLVR